MDVAFAQFKDKFMVIYEDDLTTYSKEAKDHYGHLEKIFIKALEYGVSLNPKKCAFAVTEGKLLGHIMSKDGIRIDPKRVMAIDKIPKPKNVKGIQSFFGQVNFLRRLLPILLKLVDLYQRCSRKGRK